MGLSHRINHNYLDDVLLKSSSRTLTSLQFGLSHTQKMFGGVATFNPTLSRGMPWLNAESDGNKTAICRKRSSVNGVLMPAFSARWLRICGGWRAPTGSGRRTACTAASA